MRTIATFLFVYGCLVPAAVIAGDFEYSLDDEAVTITRYIGQNVDVVIPQVINGFPVRHIGNGAFLRNRLLNSVEIPDGIQTMGINAFNGCTNLQSVSIGNHITNIGNYTFNRCYRLTYVKIGKRVASISNTAFFNCTRLTTIEVDPDNLNFSSLDGILFDKEKTILIQYPGGKDGAYAIPDGVISISAWAFRNCNGLTRVTIPDSVTTIASHAFAGCTGLTSVTIPDSVSSIGSSAFSACTSLESVLIGNGVTSIGTTAFYKCTSLTGVTIPPSVVTIGDMAFWACASLTSVTIPASVTTIGMGAFLGCSALTAVAVDPDNPNYSSLDGGLFNKDHTILIQYPGGKAGTYAIPDGVVTIGMGAFARSTRLTSVTIPAGVTGIGGWAFMDCDSLSSAYFAGNAPKSGDGIFDNTTITIFYVPNTTGWQATYAGRPTKKIGVIPSE